MKLTGTLFEHARKVLDASFEFSRPADRVVSEYFRAHRGLGQQERAFIAETVFAVLRRRRSLEAVAGSAAPADLLVAALVRMQGYSARVIETILGGAMRTITGRARVFDARGLTAAVRAELPDWLWARTAAEWGEGEAACLAEALLQPAPLDLRVNLARIGREEVLGRLVADGIAAAPTPLSPAGVRLTGKPAINRHPLFVEGLVEVQDEGSQLLSYLVAPRRGEMIADYCAGAGGKTLALAMLMRNSGRVYAMDVSARRLAELAPRAARAGVSNVHSLVLSGDNDARVKRLARKLDRVLVDAPCSGFGTLRRNPDLKWRHGASAVAELAVKQSRILESAARLVKPGGRLVYATCSILAEENQDVVARFSAAHADFEPLRCAELLAAQRISVDMPGSVLQLQPQRHGTDGFFAAAFVRRA